MIFLTHQSHSIFNFHGPACHNNQNLGTMSTTRVQGRLYYLKKAIEEQHGINQNLRTDPTILSHSLCNSYEITTIHLAGYG
jgi:hypothetical protein